MDSTTNSFKTRYPPNHNKNQPGFAGIHCRCRISDKVFVEIPFVDLDEMGEGHHDLAAMDLKE